MAINSTSGTPETARDHDKTILAAFAEFENVSDHTTMYGTHAGCQDIGGALYSRISGPYLLARLVAGVQGLTVEAHGQSAYKTTYDIVLRHKRTGLLVTFYDFKGGASYGGSDAWKAADTEAKADLKGLIDALVNDRFPHPYDGCVIGEVA